MLIRWVSELHWVGKLGDAGWSRMLLRPGSALSQVLALSRVLDPLGLGPAKVELATVAQQPGAPACRRVPAPCQSGSLDGELSPAGLEPPGLSPVMAGPASPLTSQQE